MKAFGIIGVLVIVLVAQEVVGNKEFMKNLAKTCKDKEGASDDDLDKLLEGKDPGTQEGKCLGACLGAQFGLIKDNKINKSGVMTVAAMKLKDEDKKKKLEEALDACADETDDDRCEAAVKIGECVKREAEERGLEFKMGS